MDLYDSDDSHANSDDEDLDIKAREELSLALLGN